ncbi:hypothetical protein [Lawsonibacter sp. JLR.KK007]|uniref:hypothetical protein n=1 Tax=Lawsonibacter sp. JLR.KK007 TaxID=3114293 RepID=UPI002FF0AB94
MIFEVTVMLCLDKNDLLDNMILQELSGRPVPFDIWLDAMDELAGEPDCEQLLEEKGLSREDVLRSAEAYKTGFRRRLSDRDLPVYDRFALCRLLSEQAQSEPSEELLRIYCGILCDPGLLLDHEPEITDAEDRTDYEEQIIWQYFDLLTEQNKLLHTIKQRKELAGRFEKITKENRSPKPVDCDTGRSYEILQCFLGLFDMPQKGNESILLDNLSHYIQVAGASPALKSIEPLFLFRLLTRRQSYMCSQPGFEAKLPPLWRRDNNKVDENNGRNFKQYRLNLHLFCRLCHIYRKDEAVDFPLCWYGLEQVTVLKAFYWDHIATDWRYADSEDDFPFIPTIEELVEDFLFSCFENGYGDNVLFMDSGLTYRELERFQCSSNPAISHTLEKLSDYMNCHAAELAERFLQADLPQVKVLCRDILEQAGIEGIYQPKSAHNLALFLASINGGLMDIQDYFAGQYLIQAGHALSATV